MSKDKHLTPVEKEELLARIRAGSAEARQELVKAYLPFLKKRTRELLIEYRLDFSRHDDVYQAFTLTAAEAVGNYDPDKAAFPTYLFWYLKNAIEEYIGQMESAVAVSGEVFKKHRQVINARRQMIRSGEVPTVEAIQARTNLSGAFVEFFSDETNQPRRAFSLSTPLGGDGEEGGATWMDVLADDKPEAEDLLINRDMENFRRGALMEAMASLSEREYIIIRERLLREEPTTLADLSEQFSISRERVRQIEGLALNKIRSYLDEHFDVRSIADLAGP